MSSGRPAPPYQELAAFVRGWPSPRGYTPAVAARWAVSLPTARRWIGECRRRGLLDDVSWPCGRCKGTGRIGVRNRGTIPAPREAAPTRNG